MFLLLLLLRPLLVLLLLWITVVEGCVRTIPPEEYYPSSTLPMETNLCKTCKIDEIEPENLPTGTVFESTPITSTGDCISTTAKCSRTDGKVCTSVTISSVTSTGSTVLGTTPNGNEASTRLDCEDNGLYSSGATSRIIQLACEFNGCELPELPCKTCDIVPMAPTGLPAGESFVYSQTAGADGCITAPVTCKRTDGLVCQKISLQGPGGVEITSGTSTTAAGTTLTCQGDGKFASGGVTGIDQLSCVFTDCSACTTCDISTIAPPTPAPTGTIFEFEELAAPGACKSTKVTCKRIDGMVCTTMAVEATTAAGSVNVGMSANSGEATGTLTCGPDGFYLGNGAPITRLNCPYTDCKVPCATCDIAAWAPTGLPAGESFEYSINPGPGGCIGGSATCKRTDGMICSSISLLGPGGVSIANQLSTGTVTAFLACQGDGTFTANGVTGINQLSCLFTDCVESCASCNAAALLPTNTGPSYTFEIEDFLTPCKVSQITCKRTDDHICETAKITGTTLSGTPVTVSYFNAGFVIIVLFCQGDGTFKDSSLPETVTGLTCELVNCRPPCQTCDITLFAPQTSPVGTTFEFTELAAPGTCQETQITCKRTDSQVCDIGIGLLSSSDFSSETQVDSLSATFTCDNNGNYYFGGTVIDSELVCVYNNCAQICSTCDIDSIAPVMPPGTSFVTSDGVSAGGCKQTEMHCRRTDNQVCTEISIVATIPTGDEVLVSAFGSVTEIDATLECGPDGKYDAGGPVSQITCNFVGCVAPPDPCTTCDVAGITILKSNPTIIFTSGSLGADANGCIRRRMICQGTGAPSCSVLEMTALSPGPPIDIKDGTQANILVYSDLTCAADGTFSHNGVSGITTIMCTVTCR